MTGMAANMPTVAKADTAVISRHNDTAHATRIDL